MKNKNITISKFLIKNFILFSLIVLAVFLIANVFIQIMGDKYLLTQAKNFFADSLIDQDYRNMNTSYINDLGGWISILDDDLHVIYSTNVNEVKEYTQHQLIELTNGKLNRSGKDVYASMVYFKDEMECQRIGLVCLPASNIKIKKTVTNMKNGIKNIILIYIGGIIVIIVGYVLAVWGLSYYMKKKLTNPIYKLKYAFEGISKGDYTIRVKFDAVSEFAEIRDSFNYMVKRLCDMDKEKRASYLQRQQLFSDLGHDLKTPTTIIQGYSSAILDGKVGEERREKFIRIINENAFNMGELIDLLLDYTRLERADYEITLTTCDLGEYLRRIVIENLLLYEENGINLEINIPEERIEAKIDLKIMKRAIVNLLNNILQHNPSGTNAFICVTSDKKIIIADSGEPIPEEIQDKIFEPFVCGDKARKPDRHNNGLGLSITRKIIEIHKGQLYMAIGWKEYTKAFIIELP